MSACGKLMKSTFEKLIHAEETKRFYRVLSKCHFISGDIGRCVVSLRIEEEHAGPFGNLHGGLSATLVDTISTLALTDPEDPFMYGDGASVNLNVSHLKAPAKVGQELMIEAKLLRKGRRMAFMEVDIRNKDTNDLLVKGSHTVFMTKK